MFWLWKHSSPLCAPLFELAGPFLTCQHRFCGIFVYTTHMFWIFHENCAQIMRIVSKVIYLGIAERHLLLLFSVHHWLRTWILGVWMQRFKADLDNFNFRLWMRPFELCSTDLLVASVKKRSIWDFRKLRTVIFVSWSLLYEKMVNFSRS